LERGRTFDAVAATYDAQRNGYPLELFSDVVTFAQLKAKDRVLEVGCGSGQATAGFLDKGLDVTGIDPGASLIELARSKFTGLDSVRFEVTSFEDWDSGGQQYQLVAAAQSWHWVRGDKGFGKAADVLTSNGVIAIFGHTPAWSRGLVSYLEPVYAKLAPELWGPSPETWYLPGGPIPDLIRTSGRFGRLEHRE
jgi:SAM-dependent methyltransferase